MMNLIIKTIHNIMNKNTLSYYESFFTKEIDSIDASYNKILIFKIYCSYIENLLKITKSISVNIDAECFELILPTTKAKLFIRHWFEENETDLLIMELDENNKIINNKVFDGDLLFLIKNHIKLYFE